MACRHIGLSCAIAMPRRLSSHHAQRRYKAAILDHPASGTAIAERGRLNWQAATGYGKRALIETTMGRYKALIGPRLRARCFTAQQTEVAIGCAVLNRMLATGHPDSVRRKNREP
jgi:hypothetical protein